MVMSPFIKTMSKVSSIKKTLTALPIIKKQANVSPLVVGDDLALRSGLTSPVMYDKEIVKLIHDHIEFADEEDNSKMNYPKFISSLSNVDKLSLLWALFKSTYETLGERDFKCPNENCEHSKTPFKEEVLLEDIIHEDTYTIWEEETPFNEFVHQVDVPYENMIYSFQTRLPSIKDNNRLLSTMSNDTLQTNLQQLGSIFSRSQNMALLVKAVQLQPKPDSGLDIETVQSDNLQEILMAFNSYMPLGVSDIALEKYGEKFDKYFTKFYKTANCPICGKEVTNDFDLEVEFFRRSLFG